MANQEQLKHLLQGKDIWNPWRWEQQNLSLDLRGAALGSVVLKNVDLSGVDPGVANLDEIDLHEAIYKEQPFKMLK